MKNNDDVKIKQINPRTKLNDLEKTAIIQFELENELSKTQEFSFLNKKNTNFDNKNIDLPKKKKKSLYDTVIIKLDDLINRKNGLKSKRPKKVIESTPLKVKKKLLSKRINKKIINIDDKDFSSYLYSLNKIALKNLSKTKADNVRKYSDLGKLKKITKIKINKDNYYKYQKNLNDFAINKLYYRFAPKESKSYKIYRFCIILSLLVFIGSTKIIVDWYFEGKKINNINDELNTNITSIEDGTLFNIEEPNEFGETDLYWRYLNTPLSSVDFAALKSQNSDTVGYLIVNNTNVNYPVVQTDNNYYYLTHAFDKSYNNAGWVFADYRDDFNVIGDNTVIYAHGRKDKVMFGSLTNSLEESWYTNPDNQIIQFSTEKYNTMWQIFSIYKVQEESYYITTDFPTRASLQDFINTMKSRSIYDFGINTSSSDKILTLSTCYNDNGIRLVIQAKLVKFQER